MRVCAQLEADLPAWSDAWPVPLLLEWLWPPWRLGALSAAASSPSSRSRLSPASDEPWPETGATSAAVVVRSGTSPPSSSSLPEALQVGRL